MGLFGFLYHYKQDVLSNKIRSVLKLTHRLEENSEILPLERMPKFLRIFYQAIREHESGKHEFCQHKYSCLSNVAEVNLN